METIMKLLINGLMVSLPTLSDNASKINLPINIGSCLMDQLMLYGLNP